MCSSFAFQLKTTSTLYDHHLKQEIKLDSQKNLPFNRFEIHIQAFHHETTQAWYGITAPEGMEGVWVHAHVDHITEGMERDRLITRPEGMDGISLRDLAHLETHCA